MEAVDAIGRIGHVADNNVNIDNKFVYLNLNIIVLFISFNMIFGFVVLEIGIG